MTLEHVNDTGQFIRTLRETLADRRDAAVGDCSHPGSARILGHLLRALLVFQPGVTRACSGRPGFDPIDVWCDYANQYVLIAARPGTGTTPRLAGEHPPEALRPKVEKFAAGVAKDRAGWRGWLAQRRREGQKTVLWGGGSKAVAFLTTLEVTKGIEYAVDVNRKRSGTYIAGTGQRIVAPEFIEECQPDVVIIISPVYLDEIKADLDRMGVRPRRIVTVEAAGQLAAT